MSTPPPAGQAAKRSWFQADLSGAWGGASKMTRAVALAGPGCIALAFVFALIDTTTHQGHLIIETLVGPLLLLLALGCLPAAIVLFIVDRSRYRRGRRAAAEAAVGQLRRTHAERIAAARDALGQSYTRHRETLVDEVRGILAPDRYGRRDEPAASRALSQFQVNVAEVELIELGYSSAEIEEAFEVDKFALLRAVLAAV